MELLVHQMSLPFYFTRTPWNRDYFWALPLSLVCVLQCFVLPEPRPDRQNLAGSIWHSLATSEREPSQTTACGGTAAAIRRNLERFASGCCFARRRNPCPPRR